MEALYSQNLLSISSSAFYLLLILFLAFKLKSEILKRQKIEKVEIGKNNFLADLAHRIKTPLAFIMVSLDLIERSAKEKDFSVLEKSFLNSRQSLNQLNLLCSNLMTVNRLRADFEVWQKVKVNLSDLLERSINDFCLLAGQRQLISRIEPNLVINGDPAKLTELILNLLDNAVKFTHPRLGRIVVSLTVIPNPIGDPVDSSPLSWGRRLDSRFHGNDKGRNGNVVSLKIKDNGQGIKAKNLALIFDRFYQEKNQNGSAGLGLNIVKTIAEHHQGKIELKSQENQGTEVIINFQK